MNQTGDSHRLAIVTGAASGVGAATVAQLRNDGYQVVAVDLADPPESWPRDQLTSWVKGDVVANETWSRTMAAATLHGPAELSALVVCAADIRVKPFLETALDDWNHLFQTNVVGAVLAMQAVMPGMIERGRGSIAVVCSVDSLFVEADFAAYSASKAALLQVVRSAALEHSRDGLRVNGVCPGAIDTQLFRRALEFSDDPHGELEAQLRRIPAGSILEPAEIASVIGFLLSDGASGLSGAAITVDGGLTTTYDFDLPLGTTGDG